MTLKRVDKQLKYENCSYNKNQNNDDILPNIDKIRCVFFNFFFHPTKSKIKKHSILAILTFKLDGFSLYSHFQKIIHYGKRISH